MITTLARRAVILSGCACLLGVASCGDGTAPSAPTGVPTVTVSLQSSLIAPGQGTTADIAAQAPPGDTLGAVYIFWTGLLTGGDTVLTTRRVSMATQRFFTLPASARNGTVTLTVRCITYAGKTTSTQAVLTVRDSIAPTMTWSVTPSGRMQPGDVLTVMLDAHDNALLNFTSIRITGVFSASDSMHYDEDQAAGMLTWPPSGFHVHTAVWVPEDDRAFATRLARDCARHPVALERLTYDRAAKAVPDRSDKSEGPTAGTAIVDPLAFRARVLVYIPDKGHVTTRYSGW